ncbi:MAG TPA: glycosyltransferase [Gammaproteobacteria bacterium]|nr:glycosyltransferase [Gammaproteobacteria bacterium]
MMNEDTIILVFAKAPIEGQVNTRLIPDIGVRAATRLQHDLIHQRLMMLRQAKLCAVTLMCAPDAEQAFFLECGRQYAVNLLQQSGDNLGNRMSSGITAALKNYKYCIVIGTDAPALDERLIVQAMKTLYRKDVVFVPAEDGGYVLVGLRRNCDFLFEDISWGTADVMQQSRTRLDEKKISYQELETCWDVDRLDDYQRYLEFRKVV